MNLKKFHDPKLDEVFVSSEPVFAGKLLHVHVDTVRLPNGNTATREMADHQGAEPSFLCCLTVALSLSNSTVIRWAR